LPSIPGAVPDLAHLPPGCAFHPRCAQAATACRAAVPPLVADGPGRWVACPVVQHAEAGR
nr:peptide ABC transporter ATP-binding protein [Acidobacteriota bacterium]